MCLDLAIRKQCIYIMADTLNRLRICAVRRTYSLWKIIRRKISFSLNQKTEIMLAQPAKRVFCSLIISVPTRTHMHVIIVIVIINELGHVFKSDEADMCSAAPASFAYFSLSRRGSVPEAMESREEHSSTMNQVLTEMCVCGKSKSHQDFTCVNVCVNCEHARSLAASLVYVES